jgi:hypothetical protein
LPGSSPDWGTLTDNASRIVKSILNFPLSGGVEVQLRAPSIGLFVRTYRLTVAARARLYRKGKGKEAKLSYIGNALTENRHGLVVEAELGSATGTIEREAP